MHLEQTLLISSSVNSRCVVEIYRKRLCSCKGAVRTSRVTSCSLEHAPINYFLAAVVATRTLWLVTLTPSYTKV